MLNRDDLKTTLATITVADADVGSVVPRNMRRYIYKIKVVNLFAGANLLTLGKRENGVGVTTNIDRVQCATQFETWIDPDELKDDSAPLHIIEGTGAVGNSTIRAVTDNGNCYLIIWYIDAPS